LDRAGVRLAALFVLIEPAALFVTAVLGVRTLALFLVTRETGLDLDTVEELLGGWRACLGLPARTGFTILALPATSVFFCSSLHIHLVPLRFLLRYNGWGSTKFERRIVCWTITCTSTAKVEV